MSHSTILTKLSKSYPQVLTTPQTILGPNYPKVLEFWRHIDGLSKKEMEEMDQRYWTLDSNLRLSARIAALNVAEEVVGNEFRAKAWYAAWDVTGSEVFSYATLELIGDVENKVAYDIIMQPQSKILSKFAEKYPEVFTKPQEFLGPNYLKVLKFWEHIEGLSVEEKEEMGLRFVALDDDVRNSVIDAAWDAAAEVVGEEFKNAAWCAAVNVTEWWVFGTATEELIGGVKNPIGYSVGFPKVNWNHEELEQVAEVLMVINRNGYKTVNDLIEHIKSVAESALFNDGWEFCCSGGWAVTFKKMDETPHNFYAEVTLWSFTVHRYLKDLIGSDNFKKLREGWK
jgi:hypothetical protein